MYSKKKIFFFFNYFSFLLISPATWWVFCVSYWHNFELIWQLNTLLCFKHSPIVNIFRLLFVFFFFYKKLKTIYYFFCCCYDKKCVKGQLVSQKDFCACLSNLLFYFYFKFLDKLAKKLRKGAGTVCVGVFCCA